MNWKKLFIFCVLVFSVFFMTGCEVLSKDGENFSTDENLLENQDGDVMSKISVIINNKSYDLLLEDNETVKELLNHLPQEFLMDELNGNEKYVYMDFSLPTDSSNPKEIHKGDVMLYGDNCLVIFYKSFSTSYSYTRIGYIENLPDLGSGSITIKIEK